MRRMALGVLGTLLLTLASALAYLGAAWPERGPARVEVTPHVVGLDAGGAHAWLIERGDDVVLIDAGADPKAASIAAELTRRGRSVADVDAILLTHGHRDRVAGVAAFPNAAVYVGAKDHPLARGDLMPRAPLEALRTRLGKRPPPATSFHEILPGARLEIGTLVFESIATPGHTPGAMAYRFSDLVFSGESLLRSGVPASWLFSEDAAIARRSMARLMRPGVRLICDGRGATFPPP